MKTIELIGPPGAGKTTFVENNYDGPDEYTGRQDWNRCYLESVPGGVLIGQLPSKLQTWFVQNMANLVRGQYERRFISKYPGLLETLAPIVRHYDDKQNVLYYILREAAWFEIHSERLTPDDTYIIDDGLHQFHLRLMPLDGWNEKEIMDRLPLPDEFIFVDAPASTCLKRQEERSRGRIPTLEGLSRSEAISEIEIMRKNCINIIEEAKTRDISTKSINTSTGK